MARIKGHFISRLPSTHSMKIYRISIRCIPFEHIFVIFLLREYTRPSFKALRASFLRITLSIYAILK